MPCDDDPDGLTDDRSPLGDDPVALKLLGDSKPVSDLEAPASPAHPKSRPISGIIAEAVEMPSRPGSPVNPAIERARASSPVPPPIPRRAAGRVRVPLNTEPGVASSPLHELTTVSNADNKTPADVTNGDHPHDTKETSVHPETVDNSPSDPQPTEPSQPPEISTRPERLDTVGQQPTVNGTGDHEKNSEPSPDSAVQKVVKVSWEERTWKELVKLREDMFWARVGVIP